MIKYITIGLIFSACVLNGCAPSSPIGLVDVTRIVNNWGQYQGYQAQLQLQEQAIAQKPESNAQKERDLLRLQNQFSGISQKLIAEVQGAAAQVARQRNLQLVFTRQGVGYGGVDITSDVEKVLNITETATPTPGAT